jgi:uncharacterized protein
MQLEFFDVPSPCIGICQSNSKGYCLGCYRTREERQNWINLSNDDKQKVIKRCIQRKRRKDAAAKAKPQVIALKKVNEVTEHSAQQPSLLDPPSKDNLDNSTDLDFGEFEL